MKYDFQLCETYDPTIDHIVPGKFIAEVKWDGQLAMLTEGRFLARPQRGAKTGADITDRFPEIEKPKGIVVVGELAVLSEQYPTGDFPAILRRKAINNIAQRAKADPATFIVFDLLAFDGTDVSQLPFSGSKEQPGRRELLEQYVNERNPKGWMLGEQIPISSDRDVQAMKAIMAEREQEGLVLKKLDAPHIGRRTRNFLKVKTWQEEEFTIVKTEDTIGKKGNPALVAYVKSGQVLQGVNVGAFADQDRIKANQRKGKPTRIEVKFLSKGADGSMRFPVCRRLMDK